MNNSFTDESEARCCCPTCGTRYSERLADGESRVLLADGAVLRACLACAVQTIHERGKRALATGRREETDG